MWVRERSDGLGCDEDLAGWFPREERPGRCRVYGRGAPADDAFGCLGLTP
jgi:hypothetical protein